MREQGEVGLRAETRGGELRQWVLPLVPDVEENEFRARIGGNEFRPAVGTHLGFAIRAPRRPEVHDRHLRAGDERRDLRFKRSQSCNGGRVGAQQSGGAKGEEGGEA